MKCSFRACPGEYEAQQIVHTVRNDGGVMVVDHVPAEVCDTCGDVLFSPETVRRLEHILNRPHRPSQTVPLYDYVN